jgi:undecaprenyl diphosphate synthase
MPNQTKEDSSLGLSMKNQQPHHVAVICDGNRRWARNHGFEVFKGHEKAVNEVFEPLIDFAKSKGVTHLTFWIFSTENWKRAKSEVAFLMDLFRSFFDRQVSELHKKGVRVNMIGDITGFPQDIQDKIRWGLKETRENTGIVVTLAMNYGGRDELTRAVQRIAQQILAGELLPTDINRDLISNSLDTAGAHLENAAVLPDPDLVIRTGGEQRMSGFMSWQHEYAEFAFPDLAFPELTPDRFNDILQDFYSRNRRFGG